MQWKFRPRGGQEGGAPTQAEMKRASAKMFPGEGYIDLAIPVPGFTGKTCEDHFVDEDGRCGAQSIDYWETRSGSHGWACSECGEVIQWG